MHLFGNTSSKSPALPRTVLAFGVDARHGSALHANPDGGVFAKAFFARRA
jgi:hypothetical protein